MVLGLLGTGCKEKNSESGSEPPAEKAVPESIPAPTTDKWTKIINDSTAALEKLYSEEAILLFPDGTYKEGNEEIATHYRAQGFKVKNLETEFTISTGPGGDHTYDTGEFTTEDGKTYDYLWILGVEGESLKRQLEFLAEASPVVQVPDEELRRQRDRWMELCNNHQVSQLVTEMYRENGVYYNHKPLIVGQPLITEEYGYMQDPNYRLELRPLHLNSVSEELVIEIGQASGSYNGNYLLVWQKDSTGTWKILFDSNI